VLTMNSVKILHAVRSAITATAELLVIVLCLNSHLLAEMGKRERGNGEEKGNEKRKEGNVCWLLERMATWLLRGRRRLQCGEYE